MKVKNKFGKEFVRILKQNFMKMEELSIEKKKIELVIDSS